MCYQVVCALRHDRLAAGPFLVAALPCMFVRLSPLPATLPQRIANVGRGLMAGDALLPQHLAPLGWRSARFACLGISRDERARKLKAWRLPHRRSHQMDAKNAPEWKRTFMGGDA